MTATGRITTSQLQKGSWVITTPEGYPTTRKTGPAREVESIVVQMIQGSGKARRQYVITFTDGATYSAAPAQTWTKANAPTTPATDTPKETDMPTMAAPTAPSAPAKKASKAKAAPAKAAPAAKPAAAPAFVKAAPAGLPAGYTMRWPHKSFDLYKKDDSKADGPAWLVACNYHGTMTEAKNASEGDNLGSRAGRPMWCTGCKADAAAAKKASAPKAAPKAAPAPVADGTPAKAASAAINPPKARARKAPAKAAAKK